MFLFNKKSFLEKKGYRLVKETNKNVIATKDGDNFFIKKIPKTEVDQQLISSRIESLKNVSHVHLAELKAVESDELMNYIVMDHYQEGNLSEMISEEKVGSLQEPKILDWFVEIMMGLKALHTNDVLHKNLNSKNIFWKSGLLQVGGFGLTSESSGSDLHKPKNCLPPETLTSGIYEEKSDIWSAGCILLELCTKKIVFSPVHPRIADDHFLKGFSQELRQLLREMLQNNPKDRPTAAEVLARLFAFTSLTKKSKAKVEKIQKMLKALRALADGLEKTHLGTTIGSLTGGVIGIVGGIATLGVTLAPVTLGGSFLAASLGIGLVGGITAGTSNITKLVKHKFQRKVIESLLTELGLVIAAVVTWLMERNSGLEISQSQPILENEDSFEDKAMKSLTTMGKTTHRILVRSLFLNGLFKTAKTAGQASRVAQVAKAATCALTGIFIAVDVFCVVMDAKEIHCARQASSNKNDESEIITFIKAIHKHSDDLQILVDLLNSMI